MINAVADPGVVRWVRTNPPLAQDHTPGMPEIPICVALVQSNHDYGPVESFLNMNSSQQTLDLTQHSIIFRSVPEAAIEYACKSVWFFGKWAWL